MYTRITTLFMTGKNGPYGRCSSPLDPGLQNYMRRFGSITKGGGIKTMNFGPRYRKLIGVTSY